MPELLSEVNPASLMSWEVPDPDLDPELEMRYGWVRPTMADIANVRAPEIVLPHVATQLPVELVSESLLESGALDQTVQKMLGSLGSKGVGVAAPQIGEAWSLVGMKMDGEEDLVLLANPVFNPEHGTRLSSGPARSWLIGGEGCLTLPQAVVANVRRVRAGLIDADFRVVQARRDNGSTVLRAEPWSVKRVVDQPGQSITARIAQHEIDHCNGWLFPDRVYKDLVYRGEMDRRMLTGSAFWVHAEQYAMYAEHMAKIRQVLLGHMAVEELPELPIQPLPQDQYQALRDGRIRMPRPQDV